MSIVNLMNELQKYHLRAYTWTILHTDMRPLMSYEPNYCQIYGFYNI